MTHVLVVEDDPDLQFLYQAALTGAGLEITQAEEARMAMFELAQRQFDIIILDLNLPDAFGTDVIDFIAQTPQHDVSQIIVITATEQWQKDVKRRGVNHVLIKPMNFPEVLQVIKTVQVEQAARPQPQAPAPDAPTPNAPDSDSAPDAHPPQDDGDKPQP